MGSSDYRRDRLIPLGVNLTCFTKVLKCVKDDIMLKSTDEVNWLIRYGPPQIGSEGRTRFATVTVKASLISALPFFHVSD